MESEERDRRSADVSFETIRAEKVNFGRNNFLEVARKRATTSEGTSEFISVSRGYYLPDKSERLSVPSRSPTIRKSAPSSRTRSDRCSPNRAGRRFREIRPRPLSQIGPIRVSPSARALGGSVIGLSLKRGLGYLATDPEDTAVSFVRVLAEAHTPFLWITARSLSAPPDGGDLIRVTTLAGAMGTADPRRLQDLRTAATTFFDERGPGALVVDCLDPLVVHSGVERVLRFVDDLHEETATRNALLVVFADPRRTNPRMIAWLERELDPFPRTASVPHPEQPVVA